MPEMEIQIAEFQGKVVIKIGTRVAQIHVNDVPRLIDGILRAAKLATEYNKVPKLVLPGDKT